MMNGRVPGRCRVTPLTWMARCYWLFGLVLCGSLLWSSSSAAASILATSDRDPVSLNESFTLIFSADEEPDDGPDFSSLDEDFQIVSQGRSTQVNMVNGQLSRRAEWKLTVLAKRAGTLTVPEIPFGRDRSRPFTLTVLPGKAQEARAGGDEPLMLEVEAEPKNPYVQAQVLYTIRLLHRIALRNGQLDDPKLIDAVVQKLGDDRRYQTERNGHLYGVIERRFAIFPQKSGSLRIEPIRLEAELSAGPGSMFDQFFGHQGRINRIQSDPVTLQVRPIPASFKGKHWLPAAKLQLEESWSVSPPETRVGEPITRTVSVKAEGVTMGMVPELTDKASAPAELQRYPDQPALNEEQGARGLTSTRREKTALIPMKAGDYRIPGAEIAWWNTTTDRLEIARIPERVLKAAPTPGLAAPEPGSDAVPAPVEPSDRPEVPAPAPALLPSPAERSDVWFWLTWVCAIGWVATVLSWWWKSRQAKERKAAAAASAPDFSSALRALKRASADRDPAAARHALIAWGTARWPANPPSSLEGIAERLGRSAPQQIAALNQALYGQRAGEWSGEELVRLIAEASKPGKGVSASVPDLEGNLAALYK